MNQAHPYIKHEPFQYHIGTTTAITKKQVLKICLAANGLVLTLVHKQQMNETGSLRVMEQEHKKND
jgi:hypothetical protein